jgi:hypothetical protein
MWGGKMLNHNFDMRKPSCFVLVCPALGAEAFGPFESEDDAAVWASGALPERMIFSVIPVYDRIRE